MRKETRVNISTLCIRMLLAGALTAECDQSDTSPCAERDGGMGELIRPGESNTPFRYMLQIVSFER